MTYSKGKIIVDNKAAKFGTMYYTKTNPRLSVNKQLSAILAGKTLVRVEMIVKWSFLNLFSCCKSTSNDNEFNLGNDNFTGNYNNMNNNNLANLNDYSNNNITVNFPKGTENNDINYIQSNNYKNTQQKIENKQNCLIIEQNSNNSLNLDDSVADCVLVIENIPYIKDKDEKPQGTQHNSFI